VRTTLRPRGIAGLLGIGSLTVVGAMSGLATGGARPSSAAEPLVLGQVGRVATRLSGAAAAPAVTRAAQAAIVLGLRPAANRTVADVVDRAAGVSYQEVMDLDTSGRMLAMQRFDPAGRLIGAIRFGWTGDGGQALADAAAARVRADKVVAGLGAGPSGTPRLVRSASGGWTASWTRTVAGIPVPGDGVRLQLWADGSFHGLTRSERALAAAPPVTLDRTGSRRFLDAQLDRWFSGPSRSQLVVTAVELAWVAPNDTFAPLPPGTDTSVLRLAWVAKVATTGALADKIRALEVYLDAGDGSLLGGDVLR